MAAVTAQKEAVRLSLLGDVMLGRLVNRALKSRPPEYPWGDVLPVLNQADWRICNLECVLSDRGRPWSLTPKFFHFRSDAKNIDVLTTAGINAVSVANNHVLDFDYDAMAEMLQLLGNAGILAAGAGQNQNEARKPATWTVNGWKMAMIAFTDNESEWDAERGRPGLFYVPVDLEDGRAQELLSIVKEAKSHHDTVIVSAHWGSNWGYDPLPEHDTFAYALIDAGADIVYGHSAHVCRGVQFYRGRPILYSVGDFIDDYAVDEIERNDRTFVFTVTISPEMEYRLELVPVVIRDFQALLALGPEREAMARQMERLCEKLGTPARWSEAQGVLEIAPGEDVITRRREEFVDH